MEKLPDMRTLMTEWTNYGGKTVLNEASIKLSDFDTSDYKALEMKKTREGYTVIYNAQINDVGSSGEFDDCKAAEQFDMEPVNVGKAKNYGLTEVDFEAMDFS